MPYFTMSRLDQMCIRDRVVAQGKISERCVRHVVGRGSPPAAAKSLQPCPRTLVQVGYGAGHFGLDDVGRQIGLIVPRRLIPSLGSKIISVFRDIPPPAARITAEDHTSLLIPLVNVFEIAFLRPLYNDIAVV